MKNRLRELRQSKHMTQLKLSTLSHISQSTISKIEQGTQVPDGESVLFFANFFHVSTDYFLCQSDYKYLPEFILPLTDEISEHMTFLTEYTQLSVKEQLIIQQMVTSYLYDK